MHETVLVPPFRPWGRIVCWLLRCHDWCYACRVEAKFHCVRCGLIEQLTTDGGEAV